MSHCKGVGSKVGNKRPEATKRKEGVHPFAGILIQPLLCSINLVVVMVGDCGLRGFRGIQGECRVRRIGGRHKPRGND